MPSLQDTVLMRLVGQERAKKMDERAQTDRAAEMANQQVQRLMQQQQSEHQRQYAQAEKQAEEMGYTNTIRTGEARFPRYEDQRLATAGKAGAMRAAAELEQERRKAAAAEGLAAQKFQDQLKLQRERLEDAAKAKGAEKESEGKLWRQMNMSGLGDEIKNEGHRLLELPDKIKAKLSGGQQELINQHAVKLLNLGARIQAAPESQRQELLDQRTALTLQNPLGRKILAQLYDPAARIESTQPSQPSQPVQQLTLGTPQVGSASGAFAAAAAGQDPNAKISSKRKVDESGVLDDIKSFFNGWGWGDDTPMPTIEAGE